MTTFLEELSIDHDDPKYLSLYEAGKFVAEQLFFATEQSEEMWGSRLIEIAPEVTGKSLSDSVLYKVLNRMAKDEHLYYQTRKGPGKGRPRNILMLTDEGLAKVRELQLVTA